MKTFFQIALVALGLFATPTLSAQAADGPNKATVEKWVHEYLVENPEVIQEAMMVLQERQELARIDRVRIFANEMSEFAKKDKLIHVAGNPMAPVTVIELFDYHCGYCKRVVRDVMRIAEERNDVRLIMLEYPVLGAPSQMAALAATAAQKQAPKKYMAFHNSLMSTKGTLNEGRILEIATKVGLDAGRLSKDMRSEAVAKTVSRNLEKATDVGIDGTPSFIINGEFFPGARSYDELNQLIDAAIAEKAS